VSGLTPTATRRVGWLDLSCGASGDMLLGALVDAGVPLGVPAAAIDALGLPIRLAARQVRRSGLAATKVDVVAPDTDHARTWVDIRLMLENASLPVPTRGLATATFAALAEAEARVHGIDPAEVHFHEVGALDAIADIVGVSAAIAHLGLTELIATPLALGGGRARTSHGVLPIPGPAVLELLRAAGAPASGGPVAVELCTPTGAALVVTAATGYGDLPPLRVTAIGSGAGSRDLPGRPNLVRLVVGDALDTVAVSRRGSGGHRHDTHGHAGDRVATATGADVVEAPSASAGIEAHGDARSTPRGTDRVDAGPSSSDDTHGVDAGPSASGGTDGLDVTAEVVLEANVDDLDPRVWPSVLAAVLAAGAADAWLTPILMKKGRPAHTLRALVAPERRTAVRATIFQQTSTLGLREIAVRKHALPRSIRAVEVAGHSVRVKVSPGLVSAAGSVPGSGSASPAGSGLAVGSSGPAVGELAAPVPVAQPEWDDVVLVAEKLGWPTRQVLAAACALAYGGHWSDPTGTADAPVTAADAE
jgi:uncharacterized protein (DUF111 family)